MAINKEERIPAHPPIAKGYFGKEPTRWMLMTPLMSTVGALVAFFVVAVLIVVILPTFTMNPQPSLNWAPISNQALDGRAIYLANGCVYCHSSFTRPQDYFEGPYYLYPRISEPGDYWNGEPSPNIFGTARTGPDLSQEGGQHPDDWHDAHYWSPRAPNPLSIMPRFSFLSDQEHNMLVAFNQSGGGKDGQLRVAAQNVGKHLMFVNMGMDAPAKYFPDLVNQMQQEGNFQADGKPMDKSPSGLPWMGVWMLNSFERGYWLTPDPLPATKQNLIKGKKIFLHRCVGCHGATGDGGGPAAQFLLPNPYNFTDTSAMGVPGPFSSDGDFYHRILTAGKGTAMENFGTRLSVEDIWRVVLFLRTIQNGSLQDKNSIPTEDMWQPWTPPEPLMNYVANHPIDQGPGTIDQTKSDPFAAAAHWVAPGLAEGDEVLVGGKLPMSHAILTDLIKQEYNNLIETAYNDAQGRGDPLPPKDVVMSTQGLEFHAP